MRDVVVVVGDGPAGLAATVACAEAGLPVIIVTPRPQRPWTQTYGAWVDELPASVRDLTARRWEEPHVLVDGAAPIVLRRPYALLDNEAVATSLWDRAAAAGVVTIAGTVTGHVSDDDGAIVHLADGSHIAGGLVVDASGHRPVVAPAPSPAAYQVAFGFVARLEPSPLQPGGMWFMDWRVGPLAGITGAARTPTFCYAMDLGDGWTFVQETALAARHPPPTEELHGRLLRRLAMLGVEVTETGRVERVRIPMGGALPRPAGHVVAYGAAAGMVHPATGFSVATALRRAGTLGQAVAAALGERGAMAADVASAARTAVWPSDLAAQRRLHALGLEVLLGLGAHDTQRFFRAFFALPTASWSAYVSGADSSRQVAAIMLAVFRRLPAPLAWHVASRTVAGARRSSRGPSGDGA